MKEEIVYFSTDAAIRALFVTVATVIRRSLATFAIVTAWAYAFEGVDLIDADAAIVAGRLVCAIAILFALVNVDLAVDTLETRQTHALISALRA